MISNIQPISNHFPWIPILSPSFSTLSIAGDLTKEELEEVLRALSTEGLTHSEMVEVLDDEYGFKCVTQTLQRYLREFDFTTAPKRLTKRQKQDATLLIKHYHTQ